MPTPFKSTSAAVKLSCVECARRKIKCDKEVPCSACRQSGVACTPVQRARLPRGRTKQQAALVDRVKHLEELVTSIRAEPKHEGLLAPDFWTNLDTAVEDVKAALPVTEEHGAGDLIFADSPIDWTVQLPDEQLYELYYTRFHPLFKVLHWPSIKPILEDEEALKAAVLFGAVCTTLPHELQDRDQAVEQAKRRVESCLARANVLTTMDMKVLQAFLIYLASLRTCRANAQQWTLVATAIRIASALRIPYGLYNNDVGSFKSEVKRQVWYCIGLMDLQAAFDRGSDPMLGMDDFRELPFNSKEDEMAPGRLVTLEAMNRKFFTDSSTSLLTYKAMQCQHKIVHAHKTYPSWQPWSELRAQQQKILQDFDGYVDRLRQPRSVLERFTLAVGNESLLTMQLLIHRPLMQLPLGCEKDAEDDIDVLMAAHSLLESAEFKLSSEFLQWSWFGWTKWFALAIVLAELIEKPLPWDERDQQAWSQAQSSFKSYAHLVADGDTGMLWRPIANLMLRARTKVNAFNASREQDRQTWIGTLEDIIGPSDQYTYSSPAYWSDEPWLNFVNDCQDRHPPAVELYWEEWLQMDIM